MNFKMISGIRILSISLALALITGSCSNSGNNETKGTDQEATANDSSGKAAAETQQPSAEPAINTGNSKDYTPEKEKTVENTVSKQEITTTKETSTAKNDIKTSVTSKTTSKQEINKTAETTQPVKTKTTIEQPKSEPVSPPKAVVVKEEPKVTTPTPPIPKPEPVVEKPKEVMVTQPVKQTNTVAVPAPGSWIAPAADKNKANPIKSNAESLSAGKTLFELHCVSCHGKTGRGNGSKAAQLDTPCGDFSLPVFKNQTDGSLFYKIRQGKGDMPAFKKKIPDEEDIWHLINYLRSLK